MFTRDTTPRASYEDHISWTSCPDCHMAEGVHLFGCPNKPDLDAGALDVVSDEVDA